MALVGLYVCEGCLRTWTAEECTRDRQLNPHCPSCDDLCQAVQPKPELTGIEKEFGIYGSH